MIGNHEGEYQTMSIFKTAPSRHKSRLPEKKKKNQSAKDVRRGLNDMNDTYMQICMHVI